MTTLLKIEKLSAWYGDSRVLKEVDIEINDGEIVALLGRNGMGKTTTLHSVCGIIDKICGNIYFNNNLISNLPSYEISKLGIGLVPEKLSGERFSTPIISGLFLKPHKLNEFEMSLITVLGTSFEFIINGFLPL